eukprot:Hpha_TRINITY_DN15437_c0_g2::TRINITY_DN15437_c0_g2_i1::g.173592::m.173592
MPGGVGGLRWTRVLGFSTQPPRRPAAQAAAVAGALVVLTAHNAADEGGEDAGSRNEPLVPLLYPSPPLPFRETHRDPDNQWASPPASPASASGPAMASVAAGLVVAGAAAAEFSTVAAAALRLSHITSPRPPSPRWPGKTPARAAFARGLLRRGRTDSGTGTGCGGSSCGSVAAEPECLWGAEAEQKVSEGDIQGRWKSTRKRGKCFRVSWPDVIYERTGQRYPMSLLPSGGVVVDSCTITAARRDHSGFVELKWSDGDVWTREEGGSGLCAPTPTPSPSSRAESGAMNLWEGLEMRNCEFHSSFGLMRSPSLQSLGTGSTFSTRASTPGGSVSTPSTRRRGTIRSATEFTLRPFCCDGDSHSQRSPSHGEMILHRKALLQGRWKSSRKRGGAVVVKGNEAVYERSGKCYPLSVVQGGGVILDGCRIVRIGGDGTEVLWSDGDVWTRDRASYE